MEHNDNELKSALSQSAEKIDGAEVPMPDFKYFKDLVINQQAIARRARKRQLVLFVAVAAVLLSAVLFLMGKSELFFIALQGVAFFGAVACIATFLLRSRRLSEGAPR